MKTMTIICLIIAGMLLSACSSPGLTPQEVSIITAQMEQQTLTIDCPAGCSVSYKDPRDKVVIPRQTNGWDATIAATGSLERMVSGAVPVVGMGYLGVEAVKAMRGSGTTTTTTTIGDYSGSDSGRVGDYSGGGSGATTSVVDYSGSVGDYSGAGSGNSGSLNNDVPGRVSSPNTGRFGSPDDYSTAGGGAP